MPLQVKKPITPVISTIHTNTPSTLKEYDEIMAIQEPAPKPKKDKKVNHALTPDMILYLLSLKMYPYPQTHLTAKQIKDALAAEYASIVGGR